MPKSTDTNSLQANTTEFAGEWKSEWFSDEENEKRTDLWAKNLAHRLFSDKEKQKEQETGDK